MTYIRIPIETNPETLAQDVFDYIQAHAPGWVPSDGNLDVWIIRAICSEAAINRDLISDVQDDIFRDFGSSLMGIAPVDAVAATADVTFNLLDSDGHTIPAGTQITIADDLGNPQPFATTLDIVVAPGDTSGAGLVQASVPGSAASGISGAVALLDVLAYVDTIVLAGPTSGGVDAETDTTYLARLVRRLQRLSQRPILPADFASATLDADAGVQRAVAIDGYNPGDDTYDNERMITISAVDVDGNAVSSGIKTIIDDYLQANREVNFEVFVIDPNYTEIDVAATIVVSDGFDPTAVEASVVAALTDYLSPATWGRDPKFTDSTANLTWIESGTVYYNELIAAVSNVEGVDRVAALTCNIHGDAPGVIDLTLVTPAALTTPGTITATV